MFLDVYLDYPKGIHKLPEDLPLAPVHYKVTYNELSPVSKFRCIKLKKGNLQNTYCEEELIPTFQEKTI